MNEHYHPAETLDTVTHLDELYRHPATGLDSEAMLTGAVHLGQTDHGYEPPSSYISPDPLPLPPDAPYKPEGFWHNFIVPLWDFLTPDKPRTSDSQRT